MYTSKLLFVSFTATKKIHGPNFAFLWPNFWGSIITGSRNYVELLVCIFGTKGTKYTTMLQETTLVTVNIQLQKDSDLFNVAYSHVCLTNMSFYKQWFHSLWIGVVDAQFWSHCHKTIRNATSILCWMLRLITMWLLYLFLGGVLQTIILDWLSGNKGTHIYYNVLIGNPFHSFH